MINRYPAWKYALIAAVVAISAFYALPNLFGNDPGIEVRSSRGLSLTADTLGRVEKILQEGNIELKAARFTGQSVQLRFPSPNAQLLARDVLRENLGTGYSTALTLLSGAPTWLLAANAYPMYLGLDLRGGVHFLLEVDMDSALERSLNSYASETKRVLRENKIRYRGVKLLDDNQLELTLRKADTASEARRLIRQEMPLLSLSAGDNDPAVLTMRLPDSELTDIKDRALTQNMTALRNRIDQLGVAEPVVQQQGDERIVVQLPGVQDTARAKRILGRAATLEMRMVDEEKDLEAQRSGVAPAGTRLYSFRDGRKILLNKDIIYSGNNIIDASASLDSQSGQPVVSISLDSVGASINQKITAKNINRRMAVVYVELLSETQRDADGQVILDEQGKPKRLTSKVEEVITAPVIRSQLGARFQIEGLDSVTEASDLALMLRSGSLAAPVEIIEERTVGPSLGQANINQGFWSVSVGLIVVLLFMLFYYRFFGVAANVALIVNLMMVIAVLSLFQATLTLPGVAGMVLTVGMAVDANVLIYERIREEIRLGMSPQASIHQGYGSALSTILDANITTLIAALVLFQFGTGPIKGFAVTLSVGIITSMFSSIMLTRGIVNWYYGGKRVEKLAI